MRGCVIVLSFSVGLVVGYAPRAIAFLGPLLRKDAPIDPQEQVHQIIGSYYHRAITNTLDLEKEMFARQ